MLVQRKRPVIRVGPRLAGFPSDEPVTPTPTPAPSSIVQVQATVSALMEAVAAVEGVNDKDTDEKVKQLVRNAFSSPASSKREPCHLEELPLNESEELPTPEGGVDSFYDPNAYRTEINKALGSARSKLRGPEGRKDFEDLEQIVAIEI